MLWRLGQVARALLATTDCLRRTVAGPRLRITSDVKLQAAEVGGSAHALRRPGVRLHTNAVHPDVGDIAATGRKANGGVRTDPSGQSEIGLLMPQNTVLPELDSEGDGRRSPLDGHAGGVRQSRSEPPGDERRREE